MRALAVGAGLLGILFASLPVAQPGTRPSHWDPGAGNARHAICAIFAVYCAEALLVAACETGGTFSVWARNGQYRGLFQMGAAERRRYGHGVDPWSQARAAKRYFIATAYTWRPWPECRWRVPRIRAGG